jgi:general secretion pathway protein I
VARNKTDNNGFTLIEIMVAMAIVALGITVVLEVFAGSLRLAGKSQDYSRAAFYGRQLLEEVSLQPEISEGSEQGIFEGNFTWRYDIKPHEVMLEESDVQREDFSLQTYDITVTVFWKSGKKQKQLTMETRKAVVRLAEDES